MAIALSSRSSMVLVSMAPWLIVHDGFQYVESS
jgi:hypothetical protein